MRSQFIVKKEKIIINYKLSASDQLVASWALLPNSYEETNTGDLEEVQSVKVKFARSPLAVKADQQHASESVSWSADEGRSLRGMPEILHEHQQALGD